MDYHTKSSQFLGYDEYGHPIFDTVRTEVGELLYLLKYKGRKESLDGLLKVSVDFLKSWAPPLESIVLVPPSRARASQPVEQLAKGLAVGLELPLHDVVRRPKGLKELKNVFD